MGFGTKKWFIGPNRLFPDFQSVYEPNMTSRKLGNMQILIKSVDNKWKRKNLGDIGLLARS